MDRIRRWLCGRMLFADHLDYQSTRRRSHRSWNYLL